jgi:hypothetical protein
MFLSRCEIAAAVGWPTSAHDTDEFIWNCAVVVAAGPACRLAADSLALIDRPRGGTAQRRW